MVSAPDIPGHRVTDVLGTGGFATVYRGWQVAVGREVAIKVDNRVLLNERDRRRFVREVTAAGRLSGHPHVIAVYDAGTLADGRPFLVMELCPSGSLNDALRRHGPMNAAQVRDIGVRISDALAAAHAAGVLHRDIKPANILINRYGMVGLSDFGLASIMAAEGDQSVTREALTPAYASPEAFRCEEPTVAADVYSLAATLYALLAGRPPRFPADDRSPGIATILTLHDQPVDDVPGVPPQLTGLLRQGLAADPASRPPSAAALRDALAGLALRPAARPARAAPAAAPPAQPDVPRPEGYPRPGRHASGAAGRNPSPVGDALRTTEPVTYGPPVPTRTSVPRHGPAGSSAPGSVSTPAGPAPPGPVSAGPLPAGPGPGRRLLLPAAAAAALIVLVTAALVIGAHLLPHAASAAPRGPVSPSGTGAGPAGAAVPGVFGVATVTRGCPAALVRAAAARCPQEPECWNGTVEISGNVTAGSLPCDGPHVWETFAIAILPADAQTYAQNIVAASRSVRAVCSLRVLLRSRLGPARAVPARGWEIQVLPPDQAAFDSGARAYRCIAHQITGASPRSSQFGR